MAKKKPTAPASTWTQIVGLSGSDTFRITRKAKGLITVERKPRTSVSKGANGQELVTEFKWEPFTEPEDNHRWLIATVEASPAPWE